MKRLALAAVLTGCLAPFSVMSQEVAATGPHWHVSSLTDRSLGAMNVHAASKEGSIVTVNSVLYLARPDANNGDPVDFLATVDQYDCDTPGRNRVTRAAGYRAYVLEAVFSYDNGADTPWRQANEESASMSSWEVACLGAPESTAIRGVETHEEVLENYRRKLL